MMKYSKHLLSLSFSEEDAFVQNLLLYDTWYTVIYTNILECQENVINVCTFWDDLFYHRSAVQQKQQQKDL